jgi:glycosyltransferase involved in cell wall biosynthesis
MYRGHLPALGLSWLGHSVSVGPTLPDAGELPEVRAVVGCRVAKPGPVRAWRELGEQGVRLVLDLDDDYLRLDPSNPAHQVWSDPELRGGLLASIKLADTVTVCSPYLVKAFSEYHDDVRLVLNALPAQYLSWPREYRSTQLTAGWAGTGSTVAELPLAARALSRIGEYKGGSAPVSTVLVGVSAAQGRAAGTYGERVYARGFVQKFSAYVEAVCRFDIWAAPYRDTPFNAAKYPTKFLESSMLGIPLVASAIEPYASAIEHGETGFLVPPGQEHLFGKYIKQLVDDPDLRQRIGLAARAEASASILQNRNQEWAEVLFS